MSEELLDRADVVLQAKEWRRVWQLTRLVKPAARAAAATERCITVG